MVKSLELVDTHCHLSFEPLRSNLTEVLNRSRSAGVRKIVIPAYDRASWSAIAELVENHEELYAAYGIHPWVSQENVKPGELEDYLGGKHVVAVGEIGLDFKTEKADHQRQLDLLRMQLDIAVKRDLPVLLHCRGAFEQLLGLLNEYKPHLRGVIHAFSRGPVLAERFVDCGMHLAFGGALTRPKAKQAKSSARNAPEERILLETDAPSIGLEGKRPAEVEPCDVLEIAQHMADARSTTLEEIAARTSSNAEKLFRFE